MLHLGGPGAFCLKDRRGLGPTRALLWIGASSTRVTIEWEKSRTVDLLTVDFSICYFCLSGKYQSPCANFFVLLPNSCWEARKNWRMDFDVFQRSKNNRWRSLSRESNQSSSRTWKQKIICIPNFYESPNDPEISKSLKRPKEMTESLETPQKKK